tara:strand:- start:131 stop:304 length:174 start_codon:yes stop_codon:yes gene_type:complete
MDLSNKACASLWETLEAALQVCGIDNIFAYLEEYYPNPKAAMFLGIDFPLNQLNLGY